jgi:hypothetical protein
MVNIFKDFHFQIWWPCLFIFISCPKNNTPFTKNRREIFSCKKNNGVGGYFTDIGRSKIIDVRSHATCSGVSKISNQKFVHEVLG